MMRLLYWLDSTCWLIKLSWGFEGRFPPRKTSAGGALEKVLSVPGRSENHLLTLGIPDSLPSSVSFAVK